jgi:hypothetical protein
MSLMMILYVLCKYGAIFICALISLYCDPKDYYYYLKKVLAIIYIIFNVIVFVAKLLIKKNPEQSDNRVTINEKKPLVYKGKDKQDTPAEKKGKDKQDTPAEKKGNSNEKYPHLLLIRTFLSESNEELKNLKNDKANYKLKEGLKEETKAFLKNLEKLKILDNNN